MKKIILTLTMAMICSGSLFGMNKIKKLETQIEKISQEIETVKQEINQAYVTYYKEKEKDPSYLKEEDIIGPASVGRLHSELEELYIKRKELKKELQEEQAILDEEERIRYINEETDGIPKTFTPTKNRKRRLEERLMEEQNKLKEYSTEGYNYMFQHKEEVKKINENIERIKKALKKYETEEEETEGEEVE